jgi:hypothetical protein
MSDQEYVAAKVKEAVARSAGETVTAQRLLIAWCARDDRLLRGLVSPFLRGIVAHAVERAAKAPAAAAAPAKRLSNQALDNVIGQLGQRIGTRNQPRGMTALINPPSQPAAGEGHERSLRQLAAAFARKRLEQRGR